MHQETDNNITKLIWITDKTFTAQEPTITTQAAIVKSQAKAVIVKESTLVLNEKYINAQLQRLKNA